MVLHRVGALWVVMLRVVGVVAGDAGGEGVVCDAPGDADAADVAGDALVYGVAGDADGEGGVGGARFCGAAGDDDGEGAGWWVWVWVPLGVWVVLWPCSTWAVAIPGWGPGGWRCLPVGPPVLLVPLVVPTERVP